VRAFVAVEIPPPESERRQAPAPERLTLLFLGEIPRERTGPISEALTRVAATVPAFFATLESVGAFPNAEHPRVVWTGVTEGREELVRLAGAVRAALPNEGDLSRRESEFAPHLTLFRVRSSTDFRRARELLSGSVGPPAPRRFRVGEFVLKESELSSRGATHRTLATFVLRGPAPEPA